jgi:hemoglobin/transferrin/lactoferrin receptor protein
MSKRISLRSVINITEGEEKGGIPLRHAAPMFGSTHLIYESPIIRTDIYSEYNASRKFEDMPPSEIDKPYMYATDDEGNPWSPGWFTVNLKISGKVTEWCTLNGGIENILNRRYRPYSSGIVSPGRNFFISLRVHL